MRCGLPDLEVFLCLLGKLSPLRQSSGPAAILCTLFLFLHVGNSLFIEPCQASNYRNSNCIQQLQKASLSENCLRVRQAFHKKKVKITNRAPHLLQIKAVPGTDASSGLYLPFSNCVHDGPSWCRIHLEQIGA